MPRLAGYFPKIQEEFRKISTILQGTFEKILKKQRLTTGLKFRKNAENLE